MDRHTFMYHRNRHTHRTNTMTGIGVALAVIVIFAVVVGSCASYAGRDTKIATICDKERVHTDDGGEYRVYTDKGTYVITDTIIGKVRFDTADAYGRLKVGRTYEIESNGWRIPFASSFPNILEARPLPEDQQDRTACG